MLGGLWLIWSLGDAELYQRIFPSQSGLRASRLTIDQEDGGRDCEDHFKCCLTSDGLVCQTKEGMRMRTRIRKVILVIRPI